MKIKVILRVLLATMFCIALHPSLMCKDKDNNAFREYVKKHKKEIIITSGVTVALAGLCWWQRKFVKETTLDACEGLVVGFMTWPSALFALCVDGKSNLSTAGITSVTGKTMFVLGGMTNAIVLGTGFYTIGSKIKELKNKKKDEQSKGGIKKQLSKLKALFTLLS